MQRLILTLLGIFLGVWFAWGQIQPGAPVRDFSLPKFGADGRLAWDFSGKEGVYVNAEQVDVRGMHLRVYGGAGASGVLMEMESQTSSINHRAQWAVGDGAVLARGEGFVLTGTRWRWDAHGQVLVVEENVTLLLNQTLGALLE